MANEEIRESWRLFSVKMFWLGYFGGALTVIVNILVWIYS